MIHFDGIDGLLLTIGGTTLAKWLPNLEKPAPTQTTTISIFSAMIMFTNGRTVKKISAGMYCSPRAARKIVLSRRPFSTSSTIGTTNSAGLTSPEVLSGTAADSESLCTPGITSATARVTSSAIYRAMSNHVRRSPLVIGIHFQGRIRMVPGRAQNRMPPVIGLTLPASGPHDPATPMASSSTVHRMTFWYTIGWFHHSDTCQNAGRPEVAVATVIPPIAKNTTSFRM